VDVVHLFVNNARVSLPVFVGLGSFLGESFAFSFSF
jgi:hypothetical protein